MKCNCVAMNIVCDYYDTCKAIPCNLCHNCGHGKNCHIEKKKEEEARKAENKNSSYQFTLTWSTNINNCLLEDAILFATKRLMSEINKGNLKFTIEKK
jgi:hypothetical protein